MKSFKQYITEIGVDPFKIVGAPAWTESLSSLLFDKISIPNTLAFSPTDISKPLNLGMDVMVSINQLVDIISSISGQKITKKHDLTKPQGVRGRNSDNSMLNTLLEWEPTVSLSNGLETTYLWIENQIKNNSSHS